MNEQQLVQVKEQLLSLKNEESQRGEHIREGLRTSLSDSVQELSLYDNHPADVGDVTLERAKDLGLILFIEERLAMIDDALEAIAQGKYGICELCGQEISAERLQAIPYTTLCQACKKKNENLEPFRRPVEEEVIQLPFGGLQGYHEAIENNAFDGEDAWQSVARYGSSDSPSDIGSVADYEDTFIQSGEDVGTVEDSEKIVAKKGKDGQFYQE
ncbi:MAG: TraR/DksA C4-type zinc finger protein [Clostridia bacterium]|nr:TraR/DksA C4-type zinc finger protein [Clostridia bacterium]